MLRILALLACLLASPACALDFYVATTGTDTGNGICSQSEPCKTIQHAIDLCPSNGGACTIQVADGTYTESPSVTYYRLVTIVGNCSAPTNVTLNGILAGQDHAILIASCFQLQGIFARQFTIVDYVYLTFLDNPAGIHVAAQEKSKINCVGADFALGSAAMHFAASGQSTISASCIMTVLSGSFSTAYAYSVQQSLILTGTGSVNGDQPGPKCLIGDYSLIEGGSIFPGAGTC